MRARELGVIVGALPTGALNAITDVAGVLVGHVTLHEGEAVRTGVTAVRPHGGNLFADRVPAGFAVGNGFGKFAGTSQIDELGEVETPILLTNTLSVAAGIEGCVDWTLTQPGNEGANSVNAVVGETNDGFLNDIRLRRVTAAHVREAIVGARGGAVPEGCIGAGTGTQAFGWKGGIGTSSRTVAIADATFVVGVLVQTNYGGRLAITDLEPPPRRTRETPDGSVVIVVATDAPLSDRNLRRLAARAFVGIARTGSWMANGSGDYALAFSTAPSVRRDAARRRTIAPVAELPNDLVSPLFRAAAEATEEAVYNALLAAIATTGLRGRRLEALPPEAVLRGHR
ncbi:MAG: P1 family peptidase [Acetobacteraceae bacterium]|nr:P1 family peptidase [Acetobacteraceae bacterium]